MQKNFYVTTPIYYVNAEPHIGHAYSTVLADVIKRVHQLMGYDSYFLTGTDEHGDKIVRAAAAAGKDPGDLADAISLKFREAWQSMGIANDDFIRTTEKRHSDVVIAILQKVYDSGDIYFGSYGGHYCVGCERFLTEKELVDGCCPEHSAKPEYIEEKNYFFRMSKYQGWLIEHIEKNPDFIRPERYRNEVLSLLKNDTLEDLCISRPVSRLKWGIPLPFDSGFVTYVWFDALINYVSALGYPDGEKFKKYWPVSQHIIAKDIVKAHGVFWPTMLKAAGIEPYRHLNVHGYWQMSQAKMSKSLGNVVSPANLMLKYGNDQLRFFFMREMTFGNDGKFDEDLIINRINYDLANDFGNLVSRTYNMNKKYFNGLIPQRSADTQGLEELSAAFKKAAGGYLENMSRFQTSVGIEALWEFVRLLNKYVDSKKPWTLAKSGSEDSLSSVLRNLCEGIYAVSLLISPVLVDSSSRIISALSASPSAADIDKLAEFNNLRPGAEFSDTGILFPRVEKEKKLSAPQEIKQVSETNVAADASGLIEIGDFGKIDIRVAQVLGASRIEGSEKLLELRVDSGMDERIIIAGIAAHYTPESIIGKKILLVANLKPAVIFGKKSNGMLLAAKKDRSGPLHLILVDESIPLGARLG